MEYVGKDITDNTGLTSNLVSKQEKNMLWWQKWYIFLLFYLLILIIIKVLFKILTLFE
jgi:hypothetical protein